MRDLTRRSGGRSLPAAVDRLRIYLLGWRGYYRLAQTPQVWRELDGRVRRRVRAIQLKQWKRGPTICRALLALGARPETARPVAVNSRRWWRNGGMALGGVLTRAWMDKLGLPRLA